MSSENQPDALSNLGGAFDEAKDGGYLGDKPQAPDEDAIKARRRVIGLYLFLLGYMERHPATGTGEDETQDNSYYDKVHDEEIEDALKDFQKDAGMVVDGWAGDKTWEALQELASFEQSTNIARWFDGDAPSPVLWRAVYLRLFAFGLTTYAPRPDTRLESRQKESNRDFQKGLDRFVRAARLLRLEGGELEPDLVPATLAALFDQDGIGERINDTLQDSAGLPTQTSDRKFIREFMKCTARIELWLYGYNTEFGNFKQGGPFISPDRRTQSFASAMADFIDDHGQDQKLKKAAKRDSIDALTWFFNHIVSLNHDSPDIDRTEDAEAVVDKVLADKKMGSAVQGTIKSLGARLWDGMKRVWNWIKSALGSVVKFVKRVVTNISRYVHEAALRVYSHAVAAIRAIVDGVDFLSEKVLRGSDPDHMVVFHDKDLDFNVFVNSAADPTVVRNLSERIELRSDILAVGAKIVSNLASFLMSIIRHGVTTGWFALMLALVKLYKTFKHLKEFSKRAFELFTELDALRAQG